MNKHRIAIASAVAAAIALLPATALASTVSTPETAPVARSASSPSITATQAHHVTPGPLVSIEPFLLAHQNQLGGTYLDEQNNTIYVNVTPSASAGTRQGLAKLGASLSTIASGTSQHWHLILHPAPYSMTRLQKTLQAVTTAQPWASRTKNILASWGLSTSADRVIVGLTAVTPSLQTLAAKTFSGQVTLMQQQRPRTLEKTFTTKQPPRWVRQSPARHGASGSAAPDAPSVTTPNRFDDSQPYYGGDSIVTTTAGPGGSTVILECTNAFTWADSSNQIYGTTTAGHCGGLGYYWYQGFYNPSNNTLYYTGFIGYTYYNYWSNNQPDAALLTDAPQCGPCSSWAPSVYDDGPTLTGSSHNVVGWIFTGDGETVCTDGSVTLQNCNAKVQETDICANIGAVNPNTGGSYTVKVCGLDYATSTNGSVIAWPGDSGGPVYDSSYRSSNEIAANGIISATNVDSNGNPIGTAVWFTDIGSAENTLGGFPATG